MYPFVSSSLYRLSAATRRLEHFRRIMTATPLAAATKQLPFREIRIPVPWGHIAAKEWGSPNAKFKILALHGWQDNSGTFDPLVHFLPPYCHLVAVDLPGHGHSSHKPSGTIYNLYDFVPDVRRVVLHLNWTSYSLLAHSMSVGISTAYAASYPHQVASLVGLDLIQAVTVPPASTQSRMSELIRTMLTFESRATDQKYAVSVVEAIKMLRHATNNSLSESSARILLDRGAVESGNGSGRVLFTRDPALRFFNLTGIAHEQALSLAKQVRCDVMLVVANEGLAFNRSTPQEIEATLAAFEANARSFQLVRVNGTHHFHMNEAEGIAPIVFDFLKQTNAEL